MTKCRESEEWIENFLDGDAIPPDEVRAHLLSCSPCRDYRDAMDSLAESLDTIQLPTPPDTMVDDVMSYIYQREQERSLAVFIPGLTPLLSAWKTLKRYFFFFQMPLICRREAWPIVFATIAVIWGMLITPPSESGMEFSPMQRSVTALADILRDKGELFSRTVYSIIPNFIGDFYQETETQKSDENERNEEVMIHTFPYRPLCFG